MIEYTFRSKKPLTQSIIDKLQLSKQGFQKQHEHAITRYYLDSFDNRLISKNHILEVDKLANNQHLTWYKDNHFQSATNLNKIPRFLNDFPAGPWKNRFKSILKMRALLIQTELHYEQSLYVLKNKEDKIILSIKIEINKENPAYSRMRITPVKGYDKALQKFIGKLNNALFLREEKTLYTKIVAKSLQNYPALKKHSPFKATDNSIQACKTLLFQQYMTMKHNEQGTIDNSDSEFLHDFRIAIRKSRTAFGLLKNCYSKTILAKFKPELAWLSQITSDTRDMDVYLLMFPSYRLAITAEMSPYLHPLEIHLALKQETAQQQLRQHLCSDRYHKFCLDWSVFLQSNSQINDQGKLAQKAIPWTARKQIKNSFYQVINEGRVITYPMDSEKYHDLRKTCKKLRYLLEFFRPILIKDETLSLIKSLKVLQDNLGDFQDYEVQVEKIRLFSHELTSVPPETFMAIGILTEYLQSKQEQAKMAFHDCFCQFNSTANLQLIRAIIRKEK